MALSDSQQRILADMGIQVWVRRTGPESAGTSVSAPNSESNEAFIDIEPQTELLMVMETTEMSDEAQRLLNAMIKSLSMDSSQVRTLTVIEYRQVSTSTLAGKNVLLLGRTVSQQILPASGSESSIPVSQQQAQLFACYSLEEMLQQPVCKASVWQALKPLRSVF